LWASLILLRRRRWGKECRVDGVEVDGGEVDGGEVMGAQMIPAVSK